MPLTLGQRSNQGPNSGVRVSRAVCRSFWPTVARERPRQHREPLRFVDNRTPQPRVQGAITPKPAAATNRARERLLHASVAASSSRVIAAATRTKRRNDDLYKDSNSDRDGELISQSTLLAPILFIRSSRSSGKRQTTSAPPPTRCSNGGPALRTNVKRVKACKRAALSGSSIEGPRLRSGSVEHAHTRWPNVLSREAPRLPLPAT